MLENNVDAALIGDAADFVADFLRFVIDEVVGAELFGFLQLFIGACGGDYMCAEKFRNLNGGAADAATRSENKNILPGPEFSPRKKHVPGSLENKRDRSSFFEAEIFRVWQAIYFGSADEFGTAAVDHIAEVGGLTAVVIKAGYTG